MTVEMLIRDVQAKLGLVVDGVAGIKTWTAIHGLLFEPVKISHGDNEDLAAPVAERSERVIATLQPPVRPLARALVNAAAKKGITIHVTSGLRSYAEQDALYEQGRSKPGKIVTNARGGYSSHNWGTSFDITVFANGKPKWEGPEYATVGQIGKELGLAWGGDWEIADEPHFTLRPTWAKGLSEQQFMSGLRDRHNNNTPIYA
jgi:peptidoglycan L-alanyl-D-glutamate endopeptidase CwlK